MKTIKFASAALLTFVAFGAAASASAATVNYGSTGTVGFVAPDIATPPTNPIVDPTNPTAPPTVPPTTPQPGNPGANINDVGPLTIDYASNFDFGTTNSTASTTVFALPTTWGTYDSATSTFTPATPAVTSPNFVQVTDNRGTGAGWNLTVTPTDFADASSNLLQGATVTLKNMNIVSVSQHPADTVATSDVTLTPNIESNVLLGAAAAGTGTGTNQLQFGGTGSVINGTGATVTTPTSDTTGASSIQLNVPNGAAQATTYTATFTWNLSDTPA
jgi:hypothetical protein